MGNNCPLHSAQPLGAKLNEKIRISLRQGSAILFLLCLLVRNVIEYGFIFETAVHFGHGHQKNIHLAKSSVTECASSLWHKTICRTEKENGKSFIIFRFRVFDNSSKLQLKWG